jgi:hypothetical protein
MSDKPKWSELKYTTTAVLQQSEQSLNKTSTKLTLHKITTFGGREKTARYVSEGLLAIHSILKAPKNIKSTTNTDGTRRVKCKYGSLTIRL